MTLKLQFQYSEIDKPSIFTKSEVQSLRNRLPHSSQRFLGTLTQYITV